MKKLYLAIATLSLAATLATGCGNNAVATQADSRTETESRDNKKVEFGDYFIPEIWTQSDGTQQVTAYYFDIQSFFSDYGMTEVKMLKRDKKELIYSVKFKNNLVLGLYFDDIDDGNEYYGDYILKEAVVSACAEDYDVPNSSTLRHEEKSNVKGLASWMREVNFRYHGGEVDTRFTFYHDDYGYEPYEVSRDHCEYFSPSDMCLTLYLPADFNDTFKTYIAPYLNLRTVRLDKDPLKNKIK